MVRLTDRPDLRCLHGRKTIQQQQQIHLNDKHLACSVLKFLNLIFINSLAKIMPNSTIDTESYGPKEKL